MTTATTFAPRTCSGCASGSFQESMKALPLSGAELDAHAASASSAAVHSKCGRQLTTLLVADLSGMCCFPDGAVLRRPRMLALTPRALHRPWVSLVPGFRVPSGGFMRFVRSFGTFCACLCFSLLAHGQSAPNQVHTPPQADPGVYSGRLKVDYPTRYEPATIDEIRAVLERVHAYVDQAAPVAVINGATGEAVSDLTRLPDVVALARTDLQILSYEWGVTYAGMLLAAQVTGDARYRTYTASASRRSRRWPRTPQTTAGGHDCGQLPEARARHFHSSDAVSARARRFRRHVCGVHQGGARRGGRQTTATLDRQFREVHVDRPVPVRRRHAGPQPPIGEFAVAGRSVHERALLRAGRKTHRRAPLLRRCGAAGPAVSPTRMFVPGARPVHARLGGRHERLIRRFSGRAPMAGP